MTLVFVLVVALALVALGVSVVLGGLGQADQLASVIGVLVGFAGIGFSTFGAERGRSSGAHLRGIRRVAVASEGTGILHLFAVTRHGLVVRRSYRQGTGTWSDPVDAQFPGRRARDVAAVATGHDRIECFVADRDGRLWSTAVEGDHVLPWRQLDPTRHSGAVVAIDAMSGWARHRELYAVGHDGALQHRWKWDGQPWSAWHAAHRNDCRDVALSVPTKDHMECFVIDRDGQVQHRWYRDERWSDWQPLHDPGDGFAGVALSAVNGSDRHQEVFVVGAGGELAHRWHWRDEGWDRWHRIEHSDEFVDVAVGATSPMRMECLAVGASGMLWQRSYNPSDGWSTWRQVRDD